jgi:uncharacterized membrane protein YdjX (TVP38/TMEM64 family)
MSSSSWLQRAVGAVLVAVSVGILFSYYQSSDSVPIRIRIQELLTFVHANVERRDVVIGFVAAHSIAVTLCFPGAILFEIFSGFAFGVWRAVLCVGVAKLIGGLLGFSLGRTLLRGYTRRLVDSNPRWRALFDSIGDDGFRFALLLRLSPLPSYVNNYGLALTSISYAQFVAATLLGSLPFILNNVVVGSMARSLESTLSGSVASEGDPSIDPETLRMRSIVRSALFGVGAVAMVLLVRQISQLIAQSAAKAVAVNQKQKQQQRKKTKSPSPPRRRTRSMSPARSRR